MPHGVQTDLVTEDFFVPANDPGIRLFLRNKRPKTLTRFSPDRTLIVVHGGSQAVEATFDLALDGLSWADYIAAKGWDVWLLDIRGFSKSTRPDAMDLPPEDAPTVARNEIAWADFGSAVAFIRTRRGISQLNGLGWSWGTIVAAGWASRNPGVLRRLALFGPAWAPSQAPNITGGYSRWAVAQALDRLQTGAPVDARHCLLPTEWRRAWEEATIATDDQATRYDPPRVRSPAGPLVDLADAVSSGRPLYAPEKIDAAALLVVGEWDAVTPRTQARSLFAQLTAARSKQYVELGKASHFAHLEVNRFDLFTVVQTFLDKPDSTPSEDNCPSVASAHTRHDLPPPATRSSIKDRTRAA